MTKAVRETTHIAVFLDLPPETVRTIVRSWEVKGSSLSFSSAISWDEVDNFSLPAMIATTTAMLANCPERVLWLIKTWNTPFFIVVHEQNASKLRPEGITRLLGQYVNYLVVKQGRLRPSEELSTIRSEPEFTDREMQILRGIAQGKSNREIGSDLFIGELTVKGHASRLFKKLGARDRAQAVAHGMRRGILQ